MSKQTHERSIVTEATFTITKQDGEKIEVRREFAIIENSEGGWLLVVTEPNQDDSEADVVSADTIEVPVDVAPLFDELFQLITNPAAVKA